MKIYDSFDQEVISPDLSLGHLVAEKRFVAHHPAVEAIVEVWHYEEIAVYENGGKDLAKIIDVPGVPAVEAWDEYENVLRYIPYTDEELEEIKKSKRTIWDEMAEAYNEGVQIA